MVYIAHGKTLAMIHTPLIQDHMEAWGKGPVKSHNHSVVPRMEGKSGKDAKKAFARLLNKIERDMIDLTVQQYGKYPIADLKLVTTEKDTPWDTHYDEKSGTKIPDSAIQRYYQEETKSVVDSEYFDKFLKFSNNKSIKVGDCRVFTA